MYVHSTPRTIASIEQMTQYTNARRERSRSHTHVCVVGRTGKTSNCNMLEISLALNVLAVSSWCVYAQIRIHKFAAISLVQRTFHIYYRTVIFLYCRACQADMQNTDDMHQHFGIIILLYGRRQSHSIHIHSKC